MFEGYATFGGTEVINNQRARVLAGAMGAHWFKGPRYPEIERALGPDTDFLDAETAPWYDADQDDLCKRFFGVYALRFDGLYDSTRSSPVTQNSGDGGVIGASRKGTRGLRVRAVLLAKGRDAIEYGRAWLQSVLDLGGCAQDEDCGRADVQFFAEVPTDETEAHDLSRYLKFASTVSGPFTVEQFASRGMFAYTVEWTWVSEKAHIYGPGRAVELDVAPALSLIQDAPINYIPFPSAELEEEDSGYSPPRLAKNVVTNPGMEVNATGWTHNSVTVSGSSPASYVTGGRNEDVGALGGWAYRCRLAGNGSTSASGVATIYIQTDVDITGVPAGRYIGVAVWAGYSILTGDPNAALNNFQVLATWLDSGGSPIGSPIVLDEHPSGTGIYVLPLTEPPAGAEDIRIRITGDATWSSGDEDDENSDIRIYADALSVYYIGED